MVLVGKKLFFTLIISNFSIAVISCSKLESTFDDHPKEFYEKAEIVCKKTNASHFKVKENIVYFRKKSDIELKQVHYNSLLPDGYYFCSGQLRESSILD